MLLKLMLPLLLALSMTSLHAQEEFVPSPSAFITKFPFRILTGGIILISASLDDFKDSLNFILDTGSGGISLDSTTVNRLKIKTYMSDRTIRGIAGIRKVRFAYNNILRLPGLSVDSLDFHINDYDLLTSVYGEKIDGIIGYSFLSRYIVRINYDSMSISVQTKGRIKYPRGGFLIKPFIVNIPITTATVKDNNEVNSRFYFDTGAGMCLLLSSDFVADSMLLRSKRKWLVSQAEGLGGKAPMKQGVIKQVKVGPYKFRNVPAYIFDDEFNITSYPYLGGLLGNDLLRRFNLILNYDKKDIHLLPNSHFREQFDYSYTGLGMYVVDSVIKIVDVMKNSPAEKGGFKADDIVLSVENNSSRNIQIYKNLMQNPGQKIRILVYRNGRPISLVLKVLNVLH
jgi:hypothetical protein